MKLLSIKVGSAKTGNDMRRDADHPDDDQIYGDDITQQPRLDKYKNAAKKSDDSLDGQ